MYMKCYKNLKVNKVWKEIKLSLVILLDEKLTTVDVNSDHLVLGFTSRQELSYIELIGHK